MTFEEMTGNGEKTVSLKISSEKFLFYFSRSA